MVESRIRLSARWETNFHPEVTHKVEFFPSFYIIHVVPHLLLGSVLQQTQDTLHAAPYLDDEFCIPKLLFKSCRQFLGIWHVFCWQFLLDCEILQSFRRRQLVARHCRERLIVGIGSENW